MIDLSGSWINMEIPHPEFSGFRMTWDYIGLGGRIAASSSNVPQNNLSSRSRFSGRGISLSQQELNKKMCIKIRKPQRGLFQEVPPGGFRGVLFRKPDIVEKSPVFINSTISFSNLSDIEFPERVLIYPGILKDSSSANSQG
jgi:hypothetical protein